VHANELLANDLEIKFNREVWLKIESPCVLNTRGSKLTVYPQNVTFGKFTRIVTWEHGIPGYLDGTDENSKTFSFDLSNRITINGGVILRIIRTTTRVTTDGVVIVAKGSTRPAIIGLPASDGKHKTKPVVPSLKCCGPN